MKVDPETLRATAVDRLTTGPGPDARVAVSADGRRLAYTAKSQRIRSWLFPFDATTGQIRGNGDAITSPGRMSVDTVLSADGTKVVYFTPHGESSGPSFGDVRNELWLKSLVDGREAPLMADVYSRWIKGHSGGESETVIGRWLKKSGKRNRIVLATKVGMDMGDGQIGLAPTYIRQAVDDSLRRLQTDRIDLYQAHQDDPKTPLEETLSTFADLIREGKVRAIGASNYSAARLDEALQLVEALALLLNELSLAVDEASELLTGAGEQGTNLAELGVGTNDRAQLTGNILEDEKILGTIHVAFGASAGIGGTVAVPIHLDVVVTDATLTIGDTTVLEAGRYVL
jgi:hypothetical protein